MGGRKEESLGVWGKGVLVGKCLLEIFYLLIILSWGSGGENFFCKVQRGDMGRKNGGGVLVM